MHFRSEKLPNSLILDVHVPNPQQQMCFFTIGPNEIIFNTYCLPGAIGFPSEGLHCSLAPSRHFLAFFFFWILHYLGKDVRLVFPKAINTNNNLGLSYVYISVIWIRCKDPVCNFKCNWNILTKCLEPIESLCHS